MSGLYNAFHGTNDHAYLCLQWLDLTNEQCGRYRDAWLNEDGTHITVFTRNGGGNREDYQDVFDDLALHPQYLRDYDDHFDATYAHIEFSVPAQHRAAAAALATGQPEPTLQDKTQAAIANLTTPGTRSHTIGQQIAAALHTPNPGVTVVTVSQDGITVEAAE